MVILRQGAAQVAARCVGARRWGEHAAAKYQPARPSCDCVHPRRHVSLRGSSRRQERGMCLGAAWLCHSRAQLPSATTVPKSLPGPHCGRRSCGQMDDGQHPPVRVQACVLPCGSPSGATWRLLLIAGTAATLRGCSLLVTALAVTPSRAWPPRRLCCQPPAQPARQQ